MTTAAPTTFAENQTFQLDLFEEAYTIEIEYKYSLGLG
jgi:hypothetical protein